MATNFSELAGTHVGKHGRFGNMAIEDEWFVEGVLTAVRHYRADDGDRETEVTVELFPDQSVTFSIPSDAPIFVGK